MACAVVASVRSAGRFAAAGASSDQSGTAPRVILRTAEVICVSAREDRARAERSADAGFTPAKCEAAAGRQARAPSRHDALRWRLVKSPVSIPTGQACAQPVVVAQVSRASQPRRLPGRIHPRARAAGSSRARGRSAAAASGRSRLGQRGSQKPHSMQRSISGSTEGIGFRSRRCARIVVDDHARIESPRGSASCLRRRMIATASGPHSASTNGAMFRPVPCSALSAPPWRPTTSCTRSSMKRA